MKKLKTLTKTDDQQLAAVVRTSAQQIWQAGLGAFAKAQEKGGKVFAELVKEGTDLQKRTQKISGDDDVSSVAGTLMQTTDNVSKHASGSWDKLEQVFEDRVSRSLASLGVPNQKDIQTLTKRVEELSQSIAALSQKKEVTIKKAMTKAIVKPATKTRAKGAAAKKPAVRIATKSSAKIAEKKSPKRIA